MELISAWSQSTDRPQAACDTCPPLHPEVQFRSLGLTYPRYGFQDGGTVWLVKVTTFSTGGTTTESWDAVTGPLAPASSGDTSGSVTSVVYSSENTVASAYSRAVAILDTADGSSEWAATAWGDHLNVTSPSGSPVYSAPISAGAYRFALSSISGPDALVIFLRRIELRIRLAPTDVATICEDLDLVAADLSLVVHTSDWIEPTPADDLPVPTDGSWSDVIQIDEPEEQEFDVRHELLQSVPWEGVLRVRSLVCQVARPPAFPALTGPAKYFRSATLAGPLSGVATITPTEANAVGIVATFASTWPELFDEFGNKTSDWPELTLLQRSERLGVMQSAGGPLPYFVLAGAGSDGMYGWRSASPAPDELRADFVRFGDYTITLSSPWANEDVGDLVNAYLDSVEEDEYETAGVTDLRSPTGFVGGLGEFLKVWALKRSGTWSWWEIRSVVDWEAGVPYLAGRGGSSSDWREPLSLEVTRFSLATGAAGEPTTYEVAPGDTQTLTVADGEGAMVTAATTEDTYGISYRSASAPGFSGWVLSAA